MNVLKIPPDAHKFTDFVSSSSTNSGLPPGHPLVALHERFFLDILLGLFMQVFRNFAFR